MRKIIITVLLCNVLMETPLCFYQQSLNSYDNKATEVEINADVIEIRYRKHDGKLQFRHYNVTKKRWVEPDWVDLPGQ